MIKYGKFCYKINKIVYLKGFIVVVFILGWCKGVIWIIVLVGM